ncbi:MAG: hypothetical protein AB7O67_02525 [Vicinamibacterales bacterium]
MPRVRLIHWNGPEGRERQLRLASLGYHAEFDLLDGPSPLGGIRRNPPDAFVIDLSRLLSHGREVGLALRTFKDTRQVPLVFVDGDPEKVKGIKALLPDATYTSWGRLRTALRKALAAPPPAPSASPASPFAGRPVAAKLGIKANMAVALLGAPTGFAAGLTPRPDGVRFAARATAASDLVVCFVRSARELAMHLATLSQALERQTLWVAWPKKTSGVRTDLDGNRVREAGLAAGWVDFKVCAIDETWSGLAFKKRRM